jgi:hypothetical protein
MKSTVHICKRAPKLSDAKHNNKEKSTRSEPEREYIGSRVLAVVGDLRGIGVVAKRPGFERGMLAAVSGPHAYAPGRPLRQIIISGEDLKEASKARYRAALRRLVRAGRKWAAKFAPGCRFVIWAHQDRLHPHVHVIVENWDYARNRRLDLRPKMLIEMQEMKWAEDPKLTSGVGGTGQARAGKALTAQPNGIVTTWHQRIELRAWARFKADKTVAEELLSWCRKANPAKSIEGIVGALEAGPLPPGWALRARTKRGGPMERPSVTIGGKTLRIGKFLELWLDRLGPNKTKTKPDGDYEY